MNSVRILGLTKVKNGVIFAIEDYLYADALSEHLDSNKKKKEKENEVPYQDIKSLANLGHLNIGNGQQYECRAGRNLRIHVYV